MTYPAPFVPRTDREQSIVDRARAAARVAAQHAARHDRDATFPIEGLRVLADNGYLALVVPSDYGGESATLAELALGNLELAKGDASLALVVAMHAALLGRVRDAHLWPTDRFERIARDVASMRTGGGALINSLASEPDLGSPSRGGLPATTAEQTPHATWRITGRKNFSSGAPVLRWGVVSARVAEEARSFVVPLDSPGVRIEETWDTLGMRATGSHTLVFDNVEVGPEAEVPRSDASGAGRGLPHERAWSLTVAAVYLGIAEAARDFAMQFARTRKPTALGGKSIASVPHIRARAGHIDLLLFQARAALLGVAREWATRPAADMDAALAAAKVITTNTAVAVTEEAMRLVGGSSLDRSSGIERHYRDVRGGLHHPPQDDAAIELLARQALD